jgi:dsDNA-specific endonuclease/ATPase MutS2
LSEQIAEHAPAMPSTGKPAPIEALVPGAKVKVASLGGRGEVLSLPADGRVTLQIGKLRSSVKIEDIRLDDAPPPNREQRRKAAARAKHVPEPPSEKATPAGDGTTPMRTVDNSVDIRGQRVDEALAEIDRFVEPEVRKPSM